MLTEYIQAAMRKAKYKVLEDAEGYHGEIPGFKGVFSNAKELGECRDMLQEVLEGSILHSIAAHTPLPKLAGINLQFRKPRTGVAKSPS